MCIDTLLNLGLIPIDVLYKHNLCRILLLLFASDYTSMHVHQNQSEHMPSKPSHGRNVTTPLVGLSGFPFK